MRIETIQKLCCPFDKSDLTLNIITRDEHDIILEGILSCAKCQRIYPIVSGIPIMSPDEYRDYQFEQPLLDKWEKILEEKQIKELKNTAGEK
jgi:uncharacterized protein YbaR (Trm112 family)